MTTTETPPPAPTEGPTAETGGSAPGTDAGVSVNAHETPSTTGGDDVKPQLVALMVKRGPGFSPKSGDWEYLVVDGGLTKVKQRQRTGACNDCHSAQRDRDFVLTLGVPEQR